MEYIATSTALPAIWTYIHVILKNIKNLFDMEEPMQTIKTFGRYRKQHESVLRRLSIKKEMCNMDKTVHFMAVSNMYFLNFSHASPLPVKPFNICFPSILR